ncbi:MAG: penicillin-insensitive murein endopeptidase, partial [Myxococcota bacterium]
MLALNTAILAALLFSTGPVSDESETLPEGHATTASLGHPYHGRLRDGIRLPFKGAFHTVQRSTRNRGWVYGTGYLVRGILTSARTVHQMMPPGQPLVLGNLSRRGGGDINMSMSHNSGRDVDMAYYTVDPKGQSVESRYHRFGPDGRSRKAPSRYQLDLPRNWAFVKSLLINQEFEIQWVIVAPWIERLMVKHARSAGEHPDTIRQVQRLMMQPSWAKPHDNHIHVRVLCSPEDWGKRCKNAGPVWPWNTRMLQAMDAARARIAPRLASADTRTRLDALKELRERGVDTAVLAASALLSDRELSVR